ncbi:hypothetical protein KDL45_16530, partial [bacterium]|nr:hypothetical protein [bacterium]
MATAHTGGYIQLYDFSRGPKIVNSYRPESGDFAGGIVYIPGEDGPVATLADPIADEGETQVYTLGMGRFEKVSDGKLRETTRISPLGDAAILHTVSADDAAGEDLPYAVYWGAQMHQLLPALITTGEGENYEQRRADFNKEFTLSTGVGDAGGMAYLYADYTPIGDGIPPADEPDGKDYHPKRTFLAALDGGEIGWSADKAAFLGDDFDHPAGFDGSADGRTVSNVAGDTGAALVFRGQLDANGHQTRRYLYGYADTDDVEGIIAAHAQWLADEKASETPMARMEFVADDIPWLSREMAWHSYYLQGLSVYQDYYDAHVIDQNSAYSMDQGAMGAPRDFAISIVPLIYLRPDLAKDALRFMARSQNADNGKLPYSYFGHGKQSGAVIHALSSDLDLFFLWALQEYLAATRDFAFLDEVNAYYPKSAGESGTIENHARRAFTHLRDEVGLGEHGLIKSGTGDWNDVLVAFSDKPIQTIAHGESGLNAGFAAMILPKVADLLRGRDADLADEMDDYAADQVEALQQLWMGDYAARGYLGYDDTLLGDDRLFVDTQAWAVLGGAWTDEQTTALF